MSARTSERGERLTIIGTGKTASREDLAASVVAGLTATPKVLDCAWLYDEAGSLLFEEICALPEYYLTRAEREILERDAGDILTGAPPDLTLVELGSGSAVKTRILIAELLRQRASVRYVPIDISASMLRSSSNELLQDHPGLAVYGLAMEYADGLHEMRRSVHGPKLLLWLGSNLGNFGRTEAAAFLRAVRDDLDDGDRVLIGVDLRKDAGTLERAYDDAAGVTGRFNKNVLARINRELGGKFDLDAFDYRAVYDEVAGRVDMFLKSRGEQEVEIERLALTVHFDAGESIHTESSHKYSLREIDELAAAAGFRHDARWLDSAERFSLNRLAPA
jgi:dimethylhistidine N-methyltransferase